jgi:hypothetical protein
MADTFEQTWAESLVLITRLNRRDGHGPASPSAKALDGWGGPTLYKFNPQAPWPDVTKDVGVWVSRPGDDGETTGGRFYAHGQTPTEALLAINELLAQELTTKSLSPVL